MRDDGKYREAWICLRNDVEEWANVMLSGIIDGFEALGYKTVKLEYNGSQQRIQENRELYLARARTGEPFVFVDINAVMNAKPSPSSPQGVSPRRFSMVVDSPFDHFETLSRTWENSMLGTVDRGHLSVLDALRLEREKVFFPHGGPEPLDEPAPMEKRDIDILFCGRIYPHPQSETWGNSLKNLPEVLRKIAGEATREVVEDHKSGFQAFVDSCRRFGFDPNGLETGSLAMVNGLIDIQCVTLQRQEAIKGLKDLNLHVVGQFTEGEGGLDLSKATTYGELNFSRVIELMRRSKIVLNVTPKFPDGSHERIWYGMANGAVILTSYSNFLAETFVDGESIIFLPTDMSGLKDHVSGLLEDHHKLDGIAAAAMDAYRGAHTWRERVKIIDAALNNPA